MTTAAPKRCAIWEALEAAVSRPRPDPIPEASALMKGLIHTHPFLDANKRTAVSVADVHLRMNGPELGGDSMEHHEVIIGLMESGYLDWEAIDSWLRSNAEESYPAWRGNPTTPPVDRWMRLGTSGVRPGPSRCRGVRT